MAQSRVAGSDLDSRPFTFEMNSAIRGELKGRDMLMLAAVIGPSARFQHHGHRNGKRTEVVFSLTES